MFEGLTCSGKDLQAEKLAQTLRGAGFKANFEVEPTSGPFGVVIRSFIDKTEIRGLIPAIGLTEMYSTTRPEVWGPVRDVLKKIGAKQPVSTLELQLLFMADRFWHSLALPINLEHGYNVSCARYELSTFAYGSSHGVTLDELLVLQDKVLGERYVVPDLTAYIRVSPETAVERLAKSGKVRDIYEKTEDTRKTFLAYDQVIDFGRQNNRFGKIVEIDGEASIEKVQTSILAEIRKSFGGEFNVLR